MTTSQPITVARIRKRLPQLCDWLTKAGAEVLEPTNPYEILRFRADGQTAVVYRKETSDRPTYIGDADKPIKAFFNSQPWHCTTKRKGRKMSTDIRTLRARDGDDCFFCAWPVKAEDESVEHLLAASAGGSDHISNKALAHRLCNSQFGSMSLPEKIRAHVEARLTKAMLR